MSARPGHHAARVATRHTNQVLDVADAQVRYTQARLSAKENIELCFFRGDDSQTPVPADALAVTKDAPLTAEPLISMVYCIFTVNHSRWTSSNFSTKCLTHAGPKASASRCRPFCG